MYNLLVVDDEEIAVRGIVEGIDWSGLPIAGVFRAYDAEEAKAVYQAHPIHVMISDIDMPEKNGILLLAWVKERSPATETIFLTGHADFTYAQQAVQLDSFDYLLKPIDHDVLRECVRRALEAVGAREQEEALSRTYARYYEQWHRQLPLLVERFWQDVIGMRIPATAERLEPLFSLYGMGMSVDKPVLPVLISVEEWKREWSSRDEEIMTYALKNAAIDLLLSGEEGTVFQDPGGALFALLYQPSADTAAVLPERCEAYIRNCADYFHAVVSCYIGEPVPVAGLRACAAGLSDLERGTIGQTGRVFLSGGSRAAGKSAAAFPNLQEWAALLEQGKMTELRLRVEEFFLRLQAGPIDHAYMVSYYCGLVHTVFQLLQRKSISPGELYGADEWRSGEQAMKSPGAMKAWTLRFAGQAANYVAGHARDVSAVIAKVQRYIGDHLQEELSRERIAGQVFLNPAYLSRLFRKETGRSLTDYMTELRMKKAMHGLAKTNNRISEIAAACGYANFSHFSQQFRRACGMTPQEYRKKHRDISS